MEGEATRETTERLLLSRASPSPGGFWSPGHASLCNNPPFPMSYFESPPSHLFTEGRNTSPPGAVGQSQEGDTTATLRQPQGQLPPHDLVVKFPLRLVRSPERGPVNCPRLSPCSEMLYQPRAWATSSLQGEEVVQSKRHIHRWERRQKRPSLLTPGTT